MIPSRLFKILFLTFIAVITVSCSSEKTKSPPNIIFLLADDHRADALGAAGNDIIETPNLDKLANDGVMFSNAFVTTSICACSRSSIMSGQYISRNGIIGFKEDFSDEQFALTYPQQLKREGYQIAFVGKYGIGKGNLRREKKAYDYFWGQNGQPKYENKTANGDTIHFTRLVHNKVIDFLNHLDPSKPFCLSVSFKAPHVQDNDPRQFIPQRKFQHQYADAVIPDPIDKDGYEAKFPDFFKVAPDGRINEARKRWDIRFSTPEKYQESVKGYYRLISGVDEVVGEIREKLKEQGLSKNTVIIYMGDNGFYLGEHGLAGKWYGHEPSIKVPLIIYNPSDDRCNRGKINDKLALNIDIAPTILSLAEVDDKGQIQGDDLGRICKRYPGAWRDVFYYEHLFETPVIPRSQGIRTDRYKYLYYPDSPNGYEEVYDLQNDPDELKNLAQVGDSEVLVEHLRNQFLEIQKKVK